MAKRRTDRIKIGEISDHPAYLVMADVAIYDQNAGELEWNEETGEMEPSGEYVTKNLMCIEIRFKDRYGCGYYETAIIPLSEASRIIQELLGSRDLTKAQIKTNPFCYMLHRIAFVAQFLFGYDTTKHDKKKEKKRERAANGKAGTRKAGVHSGVVRKAPSSAKDRPRARSSTCA